MAITPDPVTTPKPRLFRLRSEITYPYALLVVLAGVIGVYFMTNVIVSRLEARFKDQLLLTARQSADSIVRLEQHHLEIWRSIAFTQGLPEAANSADEYALANIAGLAALNVCQDTVDVLDVAGRPIFAAHRTSGSSCDSYQFVPWGESNSWEVVRKVIAGTADDQGDKFCDLVKAEEEWLLLTTGPIYDSEGKRTGILLVGTYLDTLVRQIKLETLADVTVFGADGIPLATTFNDSDDSNAIPADLYLQTLEDQGSSILRHEFSQANQEYAQILGPLEVRGGQDLAVLGVSLPTGWIVRTAYPARNLLMVIIVLIVLAVFVTGYLLSTRIVRPVNALIAASHRVALGNLDQRVVVESGNEIGTLSEFFNRMVEGLRERERVKDLFGRHVGEKVTDEIIKGRIAIGGRRVEATVLSAEIRDFSSLCETTEPALLVRSLQEYFTEMISEIEVQHGLINKFGGASILALFGAPIFYPDHAQQALHAALRMVERMERLNEKRKRRGETPLQLGIGINSGQMVVGNIGTHQRSEFGVIGDAVSVALQLGSMNRHLPFASIFISRSTLDRLDWMANGLVLENLGEEQVKSITGTVMVYAVKGWM